MMFQVYSKMIQLYIHTHTHIYIYIVVVQSLSCVQLPATAARRASPSFTISQSLLRFISIELVIYLTISSSALFSFCLQSPQLDNS